MLTDRQRAQLKALDEKASGLRLYRWLKRLVIYLGGREPVVLLVLLTIIVAGWGFIELAEEVLEGDTQAFDRWAVRAMRKPDNLGEPIGPLWVQEMGRDATALGGLGWLVFFTLVVAGYLWLDGRGRMAALLLTATASGALVSSLLKQAFSRPRPDIVPHLSHVHTASFPSGHSMLSAVVYLTLGALLAASLPRARLKVYVLSIAAMLTLVVGASRVYLGVHYPTDVLAGWSAGLVWSLGCWLVAHWLQQKGKVEAEDAPAPEETDTDDSAPMQAAADKAAPEQAAAEPSAPQRTARENTTNEASGRAAPSNRAEP